MKSYDGFVKEGRLNEDENWYKENGYISHPEIDDLDTLRAKIEDAIGDALKDFCKRQGIYPMTVEVSEGRHGKLWISAASENIDPADLGVFANVLSWAKLTFSGGEINSAKKDGGEFVFVPYIWTTLSISYEAQSGGSNGMAYPLTKTGGRPNNELYYDILEGAWYTAEDYRKKLKNQENK